MEPLRGSREPVDLGEISLRNSFRTHHPSVDEIFDRIGNNFRPTARPKAERLQSLCLEFVLTPEEARRGGQMRIFMPAQIPCPTCSGLGAVGPYHCWRCMGNGSLLGEMPLIVEFGPGISDGYQRAIALDHFGIRDVYLTLLFRIGRTSDIEDG